MPAKIGARRPSDDKEEQSVRRIVAARNVPRGLWQRALIVAMSWDGASVGEIARETGLRPRTVRHWLERFGAAGVDGLTDRPRSGRPLVVSEPQRAWLISTAAGDPAEMGVGRWTLSTLVAVAAEAGITISRTQLRRILRMAGVSWTQRSRTNGTPDPTMGA